MRQEPAPPPGRLRFEGSQDGIDLVTGLRRKKDFNDHWSLWARGDVGGFGIGDSSNLTWNPLAMGQWRFARA